MKENHESKNATDPFWQKIPAQKVTNHSLPRGIETFIDLSKLDNARPIEVGFCGAIGLTQHKAEIWTCDRSRSFSWLHEKSDQALTYKKMYNQLS